MSNNKDTVKVVNLKMWKDGNWGYVLPNRKAITDEVECKSGMRMVTIASRYQRDEEGNPILDQNIIKEQASYKVHYIALDDYYNSMTKDEVLADGWTNKCYLDVMTGEYERIQD